jgi:hypothetical protein
MKLHFSASLREIDKHIATYELIERTIKDSGHFITKEWLQEYKDKKAGNSYFSEEEWLEISKDTIGSIQEADAIIIEASISSYNMGYLSALALSRKKPLLMLFNTEPHAYILDANNTLRRAEVYGNKEELQKIIVSFLEEIDIDNTKLRFNMTLDREVYNYLNWESVNTGKTKAQIVREVLKEQIRKKT